MCVPFPSQVVYKTNDDHVTVVAAGVTLHEALAAAEQLKKGTQRETKENHPALTLRVYSLMRSRLV